MLKKKLVRAACLSALMVVGSSAGAQNSYMGLSGGLSSWGLECSGTVACDQRGVSIKLFAGHNVTQNFGVEGGYFSLGRSSRILGANSYEWKTNGFELFGVARAPLNDKLSGFAKLGLAATNGFRIKADVATGASTSSDTSSIKPAFGLGATYELGNGLQFRGEWDRRQAEVPVDGLNADEKLTVNNFSVGIQYNF